MAKIVTTPYFSKNNNKIINNRDVKNKKELAFQSLNNTPYDPIYKKKFAF